jgi:hypothetical protein
MSWLLICVCVLVAAAVFGAALGAILLGLDIVEHWLEEDFDGY